LDTPLDKMVRSIGGRRSNQTNATRPLYSGTPGNGKTYDLADATLRAAAFQKKKDENKNIISCKTKDRKGSCSPGSQP
jgi:hypothetical protein